MTENRRRAMILLPDLISDMLPKLDMAAKARTRRSGRNCGSRRRCPPAGCARFRPPEELEPFSDPVGEGSEAQADALEHDIRDDVRRFASG